MADVATLFSTVTVTLGDVLKISTLCFIAGGIVFTIRNNSSRIRKLEQHRDELPDKIAEAVATPLNRIEAAYKERIDRIESSHLALQDRFLTAIDNLGEKMGALSSELRSVVAAHEERFRAIEKQQDREA